MKDLRLRTRLKTRARVLPNGHHDLMSGATLFISLVLNR